ncbi:DUF4105 domain-containing protein [Xanthomonadaceae bacterium JHOS43]|nr:DUF4105 domain-containing protein [Xanthomonadaceae bacterium JHOS43]
MNVRCLRRGFVGTLLGFASLSASAAWPPVLDAGTLTPTERIAATALIERTGEHLPAAMADHLPALTLSFSDALPDAVHGRIRGRRIRLARDLLHDGDDAPAIAALLHELAHALDRRAGLSRDPRLLDLAGWQVKPRRFGLRNSRSRLRDRSPDIYELASPREFVAVNVEHFLRDADYACRRPALHRFLAERIGMPRHANAPQCAPGFSFVVPASDPSLETLDPARVHAIEYLLAEPTDAPMSRWGHSMLRLVICAPGRVPGPDCRFDLEHHRVLSFRAFVDDVQTSGWRGLTGRYPSRLFVLPLTQVIEEYTAIELRGLRSVPLRLSDEEKASLIERAAQLHWSYDGRYTFLGNNCASETFKLLHDGVPRLAGEPIGAIAPTALLRRLERAGIADAAPLASEDAVRLGYYFPSADSHYADLFAIARAALALPARDARAWLDLAPEQRAPWVEAGDLRASAALLVLEEAALRRAHLRARDAIKRRLLQRDNHARASRVLLDEHLALEASLIRPAALLADTPGYGLPQADERALLAVRGNRLSADWRTRGERFREHTLEVLSPALHRLLADTTDNLDRISAHLRRMSSD